MSVNVKFWFKALKVIPRLTREEWDDLDLVSRWLVSTRFAAVVLTAFSVLIAGLLSYQTRPVNVLVWVGMLVALLFAHATNNIINDLVDFRKGVDKENYFRDLYGPQPVQLGFRTQKQQLRYAIVNGIIAGGIGAFVSGYRGGLAWVLMGLGFLFMVFYTYPLKYFAAGEVSLLLVWGPLMVGGGYYVLVGAWSWMVVVASLPYALGVTAALMAKHIDKYEYDKEAGVHTLPVVIGEAAARYVVLVLIALQYVITGYLIVTGFFTPIMALVVLALPQYIRKVIPPFLKPRPTERPEAYPESAWPLWFVAFTFVYSRTFGGLFVLALLLDTAAKLWFLSV